MISLSLHLEVAPNGYQIVSSGNGESMTLPVSFFCNVEPLRIIYSGESLVDDSTGFVYGLIVQFNDTMGQFFRVLEFEYLRELTKFETHSYFLL
jgi:hypothetical protein